MASQYDRRRRQYRARHPYNFLFLPLASPLDKVVRVSGTILLSPVVALTHPVYVDDPDIHGHTYVV